MLQTQSNCSFPLITQITSSDENSSVKICVICGKKKYNPTTRGSDFKSKALVKATVDAVDLAGQSSNFLVGDLTCIKML